MTFKYGADGENIHTGGYWYGYTYYPMLNNELNFLDNFNLIPKDVNKLIINKELLLENELRNIYLLFDIHDEGVIINGVLTNEIKFYIKNNK